MMLDHRIMLNEHRSQIIYKTIIIWNYIVIRAIETEEQHSRLEQNQDLTFIFKRD